MEFRGMQQSGLVVAVGLLLFFTACTDFAGSPVGNKNVPQPTKPVDLHQYVGRWYEIARYENRFQTGCEYVVADYSVDDDGSIKVVNSCRRGGIDGPLDVAEGRARVVEESQNAKLRVTFFWPFWGNYWVLDRDASYDWSIVGEPSGRYLWFLFRNPHPSAETIKQVKKRASEMGYDISLLRMTQQ